MITRNLTIIIVRLVGVRLDNMADERTVPADNFCATLAVNINNENLTDTEFRAFVRNSLPIVQFSKPVNQVVKDEYQRLTQERYGELALSPSPLTDDEQKEFEALKQELEGDVIDFS